MYCWSLASILGDFKLTWQHCLEGLSIALKSHIFEWSHFNPSLYDQMARVENGDMNWIIIDRLLAFSGPHEFPEVIDGVRTLTPEDYLPIFQRLGIGVVIRLNKPAYDSKRFSKNGIDFYDLYFPDGGLPQCGYRSFLTSSQPASQVHRYSEDSRLWSGGSLQGGTGANWNSHLCVSDVRTQDER